MSDKLEKLLNDFGFNIKIRSYKKHKYNSYYISINGLLYEFCFKHNESSLEFGLKNISINRYIHISNHHINDNEIINRLINILKDNPHFRNVLRKKKIKELLG